jgi:hypothetical protein
MPTSFNTPEQWRRRAREARALTKQMRDPESKRALARVAESYEKIAKRAEAKLAAKKAKKPARPISDPPLRASPPGDKPSAVATEMHIEAPTAAKAVEIFPRNTQSEAPPVRAGNQRIREAAPKLTGLCRKGRPSQRQAGRAVVRPARRGR